MTYSFKKIPTRSRLRTILVDLSDIIEEESVSVRAHKPLADAAVIFLREASNAVGNPIDNAQMSKDLVISALDFSQRWENWLNGLKYGDLEHPATKVLHEMLLRLFKGYIKAYRCWLIDTRK